MKPADLKLKEAFEACLLMAWRAPRPNATRLTLRHCGQALSPKDILSAFHKRAQMLAGGVCDNAKL
jgi:hypothetical protein